MYIGYFYILLIQMTIQTSPKIDWYPSLLYKYTICISKEQEHKYSKNTFGSYTLKTVRLSVSFMSSSNMCKYLYISLQQKFRI